jgi:pantoate--beta-alanine ligase
MQTLENISLMQQACWSATKPLIFVPTMGALHQGHASLISDARKRAGKNGTVVVSIFLNPKQFHVAKDFDLYPRTLEADQVLCEQLGADLLFAPCVKEIYPSDNSIGVLEYELSAKLCGASRPGHFSGVVTILTKLFNIIAPTHVIFGEKDWQQLIITRRLVRDLHFPIEVISHPTVREEDGLAMSSRNKRLSKTERKVACKIYETLREVRARALNGESDTSVLLDFARKKLMAIRQATIDYVEILDEQRLQSLKKLTPGMTTARLFVALNIGETRLIDNIALSRIFHTDLLRRSGSESDPALDSHCDLSSMYTYSPASKYSSALPTQPSQSPLHDQHETSGLRNEY